MWQFTASLNWSVSRDGAQRSQESGPILSSLPLLNPFPHTASLLAIWLTQRISAHITRSPYITGAQYHTPGCLRLSSLHSEHNANPWPHNMSSVLLLSLCAFLPPPPSSLANKASDPGLSEAAPDPGPGPRKLPPSPSVARYFPGFKPRYFLHL